MPTFPFFTTDPPTGTTAQDEQQINAANLWNAQPYEPFNWNRQALEQVLRQHQAAMQAAAEQAVMMGDGTVTVTWGEYKTKKKKAARPAVKCRLPEWL